MSCVFCKRNVSTREHHIVPRCKGGKETVSACESCESFIHRTWTHNELRDVYHNVQVITANDKFQKFLKWLHKQKPETLFTSSMSNTRRRKGKYS